MKRRDGDGDGDERRKKMSKGVSYRTGNCRKQLLVGRAQAIPRHLQITDARTNNTSML